jgi:hypothetical protein
MPECVQLLKEMNRRAAKEANKIHELMTKKKDDTRKS